MNEETVRPRITTAELESEIKGIYSWEELSIRSQALYDLRDERFSRAKLKHKLQRMEKDLREVKRRSTRRAIQTSDLLKTLEKMRDQRDSYADALHNMFDKAFSQDVDGKHYYTYHGEVALEDVGIPIPGCLVCHGVHSEHCDNCKNMEGMPGTKPPAIGCMHQGHNFAMGPCPACGMDIFGSGRQEY